MRKFGLDLLLNQRLHRRISLITGVAERSEKLTAYLKMREI